MGIDERYTLHQGDCLDILPTLEAETIDLTVTSPPYDNLRDYGQDFDAESFDWCSIIRALYRVTKPGGVVVWVVADETINGSETGTSFKQALWAMECGFNLHDTMIYKQSGTGAKGSNYAYWQAFEYMFIWSKGRPSTVNRIRDKINKRAGNKNAGGTAHRIRNTRRERPRTVPPLGIRENVWTYHSGKSKGFSQKDFDATIAHPAVMPEPLARDHILSWSNPGDTVLDPMMGRGTTGKMAIQTGRLFVGIEMNADYYQIAQQYLKSAVGEFVLTDRERETGQLALFGNGAQQP